MSHTRRHHSSRRHRNPFSTGGVGPLAVKIAGGLGGGIAAATVPGMLSSSFSTGWTGVAGGAVVALGGAWLLRRMSPNAGEGWLIGGLLQTAGRVAQLLIGRNLVSFSLSGYGPLQFPVPTPAYRLNAGASVVPMVPGSAAKTSGNAPRVAASPASGMGKYRYKFAA